MKSKVCTSKHGQQCETRINHRNGIEHEQLAVSHLQGRDKHDGGLSKEWKVRHRHRTDVINPFVISTCFAHQTTHRNAIPIPIIPSKGKITLMTEERNNRNEKRRLRRKKHIRQIQQNRVLARDKFFSNKKE